MYLKFTIEPKALQSTCSVIVLTRSQAEGENNLNDHQKTYLFFAVVDLINFKLLLL